MRLTAIRTVSTLGVLALLVGLSAYAQQASNMGILRDKLAADKKLLVASNLPLTTAQAETFWPIYESYQRELEAINRRTGALIVNYAQAYNAGPVSDAKATELVDEYIAIEEAEVALKKSYAARLSDSVSATVAARYLQIEQKIRAIVKYDLASEIPLVE